MGELTREQKLEILDKVADGTATKEEIEAAGGALEILKMIGEEGSKERGQKRKHIYSPGKFSLWVK